MSYDTANGNLNNMAPIVMEDITNAFKELAMKEEEKMFTEKMEDDDDNESIYCDDELNIYELCSKKKMMTEFNRMCYNTMFEGVTSQNDWIQTNPPHFSSIPSQLPVHGEEDIEDDDDDVMSVYCFSPPLNEDEDVFQNDDLDFEEFNDDEDYDEQEQWDDAKSSIYCDSELEKHLGKDSDVISVKSTETARSPTPSVNGDDDKSSVYCFENENVQIGEEGEEGFNQYAEFGGSRRETPTLIKVENELEYLREDSDLIAVKSTETASSPTLSVNGEDDSKSSVYCWEEKNVQYGEEDGEENENMCNCSACCEYRERNEILSSDTSEDEDIEEDNKSSVYCFEKEDDRDSLHTAQTPTPSINGDYEEDSKSSVYCFEKDDDRESLHTARSPSPSIYGEDEEDSKSSVYCWEKETLKDEEEDGKSSVYCFEKEEQKDDKIVCNCFLCQEQPVRGFETDLSSLDYTQEDEEEEDSDFSSDEDEEESEEESEEETKEEDKDSIYCFEMEKQPVLSYDRTSMLSLRTAIDEEDKESVYCWENEDDEKKSEYSFEKEEQEMIEEKEDNESVYCFEMENPREVLRMSLDEIYKSIDEYIRTRKQWDDEDEKESVYCFEMQTNYGTESVYCFDMENDDDDRMSQISMVTAKLTPVDDDDDRMSVYCWEKKEDEEEEFSDDADWEEDEDDDVYSIYCDDSLNDFTSCERLLKQYYDFDTESTCTAIETMPFDLVRPSSAMSIYADPTLNNLSYPKAFLNEFDALVTRDFNDVAMQLQQLERAYITSMPTDYMFGYMF